MEAWITRLKPFPNPAQKRASSLKYAWERKEGAKVPYRAHWPIHLIRICSLTQTATFQIEEGYRQKYMWLPQQHGQKRAKWVFSVAQFQIWNFFKFLSWQKYDKIKKQTELEKFLTQPDEICPRWMLHKTSDASEHLNSICDDDTAAVQEAPRRSRGRAERMRRVRVNKLPSFLSSALEFSCVVDW